MQERRVVRVRPDSFRPAGGVSATLSRRTGRGDPRPPKDVVSYFGDDSDTPLIEMLKRTPPNIDRFREGNYVHVSDVVSKCLRKIALVQRAGQTMPAETVFDGHGITYALGEAVHDFVKARFIKGHPDKVFALWKCKCGKSDFTGLYRDRPKAPCNQCGTKIDQHHEIRFVFEKYNLSGSPDLLLLLQEYDAFLINEIKSMSAELWKDLCRPVPTHKIQVSLYWYIMKALGYRVVDRVSLLYVNKEFSFKLPYKEFLIEPEKEDLEMYWDDLEALKRALAGGALPLRTICGSPTAPEAKKCPVCVTCFQTP